MGELIVQKATELFFQYGLKSVSMDELASSSGISKKTIYRFVSDKNALVDKVVDQLLGSYSQLLKESQLEARNAIEEVVSASCMPFYSLASISQSFFHDLEKHYPQSWSKLQIYKSRKLLPVILDNLDRGKGEGLYRANLDTAFIGQYRLQQISSALNPAAAGMTKSDSCLLMAQFTSLYLYGISSGKARRLIDKNLDKINIDNKRK